MGFTTGPARFPGSTTFPGSDQYPGQGNVIETYGLWVLVSYDDVSEPTPEWHTVTSDVRLANWSRGVDPTVTSDPEPGGATVVFDNRSRTYDPIQNFWIRPLNRVWIRSQFVGETQDLFKGYVENWGQAYPTFNDAVAVANCKDEIKNLSLDSVQVMDPSFAESYEAVVMFDLPGAYWRCDDYSGTEKVVAAVGGQDLNWTGSGTFGSTSATAITGDTGGAISLGPVGGSGAAAQTNILEPGDAGEVAGLAEFTISFWFKYDVTSISTRSICTGPADSGANVFYYLEINASGQIIGHTRNAAGTNYTVTGASIPANTWVHLTLTVESGSTRLYYNGVQAASTAWTSTFNATLGATSVFSIGDTAATTQTFSYDEIWFKRIGLPIARVLAHYQAGALRGFPGNVLPGDRLNAVLDSASSQAPRSFEAGSREMVPVFAHGQDPLAECKEAVRAQTVSAMFFAAGDGTLTFFSTRSSGVATDIFGDAGGAELPYLLDFVLDNSDAFLVNEWTATRRDWPGRQTPPALQTASDASSIYTYFKRSQNLSDLPIRDDADVLALVNALLAETKDPRVRIVQISFSTGLSTTVAATILRYELGDTARVKNTPPGGGSRIDQSSLLLKIEGSATPGTPWSLTWSIQPVGPFA